MNTVKLMKSLGFNPNIIESKQLKKEFISLLEILLKDISLTGKEYEKVEYTTSTEVPSGMLKYLSIDKIAELYSGKHVDSSKHTMEVEAYNNNTSRRYTIGITYDDSKNKYYFYGYTSALQDFGFNASTDSFCVEYDLKTKRIQAENNFMNMLVFTTEKYDIQHTGEDDVVVARKDTYTYDANSVKAYEEKYMEYTDASNFEKLYKNGTIEESFRKYFTLFNKRIICATNSSTPVRNTVIDQKTNQAVPIKIRNGVTGVNLLGSYEYYNIRLKTSSFVKRTSVLDILSSEEYIKMSMQNTGKQKTKK